jgi:hypothetical protein
MNYKKLVPEDSFIGQYMKYMSVVETAESYDFWCAVWGIGVGCGRSVYVGRPNAPVYLNWYIILAAESGETRKSTAISSITDVIGDEQEFLKGKTSPEALELILHEHTRTKGSAAISMAVSELVTILGREGYMSTMPGLLTDLYDCPSYRNSPGTIKSGEIIQKDVYVNFISASTPAWLVTAINPSVIEGGFTSRVIFVVDDTRKRAIAWPEERNSEDKLRLVKVYNDSIVNARAEGVLKISTGGLKTFKHWYINKSNHTDPFLSSFEAREDDHILRLAAILCINDGTLEIQHSHIKNSIKIVSDVKSKANNLFGGDFSQKARITGAVTRVREILMDSGTDGIKHSDLQRRVVRHTDAKELRMLINIMHECGMLSIFKMKRGEMYRANQAIEKLGVTTEVLSKLNC